MSIPRWIRRCEPKLVPRFVPKLVPIGPAVWQLPETNLVPIGAAFWQLPQTFESVPPTSPKCPRGIEGRLGFSLCPFPDESADVNQSWCQSVQPFDTCPRLLNVWPLKPPSVSRGNLFRVYPFPDGSADVCRFVPKLVPIGPAVWQLPETNLVPIGAAFWQLPQTFESVPPTSPKCPRGIEGRLGFSLCPFPDESADVNQSWCQSVQPFDSCPRLLNVWPLKPPSVSRGNLFRVYPFPDGSADVCIFVPKLVPIGPAVWQLPETNLVPIGAAFWQLPQTFESVPPTSPKCPRGIEGRLGFSLCPFPDESADVNQSWCQSVQPFDSCPRLLNVWPLKPPSVSRVNLFRVYPFPDGSADVCQIWCQSVQPFDSFPRLLNLWHPNNPPPPEMPPGVLRGDLYLTYVHSQMNPQTWTKVGANRTASQYFWIVDPLKPPQVPPLSRGAVCLAYINPIWISTCVPNLVPIGPAVW